jgi:hypothetical protein
MGSNFSLNLIQECTGQFENGAMWRIEASDHNVWKSIGGFRVAGGTGNGIELHGGATASDRSRYELFIYLSFGSSDSFGSGPTIKVFGTDTYTSPSIGHKILFFDLNQGTSNPILETGATLDWQTDTGDYHLYGNVSVETEQSGANGNAITAKNTTTNASGETYALIANHQENAQVNGAGDRTSVLASVKKNTSYDNTAGMRGLLARTLDGSGATGSTTAFANAFNAGNNLMYGTYTLVSGGVIQGNIGNAVIPTLNGLWIPASVGTGVANYTGLSIDVCTIGSGTNRSLKTGGDCLFQADVEIVGDLVLAGGAYGVDPNGDADFRDVLCRFHQATSGYTGDVTGNVSGNAGTVTISGVSTDANYAVLFTTGSGAVRQDSVSANFAYNPFDNLLTVLNADIGTVTYDTLNDGTDDITATAAQINTARDILYAELSANQDVTGTNGVFYRVQFNTDTESDGAFSIDTVTNVGRVTISTAGRYIFTLVLYLKAQGSPAGTVSARIVEDPAGTPVYHKQTTAVIDVTNSREPVIIKYPITISGSTEFDIEVARINGGTGGTDTIRIMNDASWTIEEK